MGGPTPVLNRSIRSIIGADEFIDPLLWPFERARKSEEFEDGVGFRFNRVERAQPPGWDTRLV